jgi:proteasome lid subunit RPN8/RPN11
VSPGVLEALEHCRRAWPHEGVGAVVAGVFVPFHNRSSTPGTSFEIDPIQWMTFETAALGSPCCLVHSHVDAPAELSARDRAAFTVDGRPLLPFLTLLVVSVRAAVVAETSQWAFVEGAWRRAPAL